MTPHPDEIAALLALPPAVRHALAGCAGPGWLVQPDREPRPMPSPDRVLWESGPVPDGWAWLPADSCEIVRVAAEHAGVTTHRAWEWLLFKHNHADRLAALRLLAEVANG